MILVGCKDTSNLISIEEKNKYIEVDKNEISQTIKDIATYKSELGTDGEKKKANYLKSKMESYGYTVEFQDFYVVAHYDTTNNTIGVSTVSEIARVLQYYNNKDFNLVFIFFSAEENFKKGSRYFISQLSEDERKSILGAINIDMVGYTNYESIENGETFTPIGKPHILSNSWVESDKLEKSFNVKYDNKYDVNGEEGGQSDDLTFTRIGVPTLYFADKNFGFGYQIESENFEIQFKPINFDVLFDLINDISNYIKDIDINDFDKLFKFDNIFR